MKSEIKFWLGLTIMIIAPMTIIFSPVGILGYCLAKEELREE